MNATMAPRKPSKNGKQPSDRHKKKPLGIRGDDRLRSALDAYAASVDRRRADAGQLLLKEILKEKGFYPPEP